MLAFHSVDLLPLESRDTGVAVKRLALFFLVVGLMGCSQSSGPDPWLQDGGEVGDANPRTDLPQDDIREMDVQPDGTDRPDTDPDGDSGPRCDPDLDSDDDGVNNCDEQELCTDPDVKDTDEDDLTDFEELQAGTDPCDPDTDDDGASDETELEVGLNPNNPSTFSDGVLDGDRWRVEACRFPEVPDGGFTDHVDYYSSDVGNYRIGLSPAFSNYRQLQLNNTPHPVAAGTYGDSLSSVYGFIVSKNAEDGRTKPDGTLRDEIRPEILDLAGNDSDNLTVDRTGAVFETRWDRSAAIGQYEIKSPSPTSSAKIRQKLMLNLGAFERGDVGGGGLPSTSGQAYSEFRIIVSVIFRRNHSGPSQALVSAAVAPASVYDNREHVRFQIDDLTNTTSIAEFVDDPLMGCEKFLPSEEVPKVYFYWVLDQSGSLEGYNSDLASLASGFTRRLQRTQMDYHLGVTNMDVDNEGRVYNPWTQDPSRFLSDIQQAGIGCSAGGPWACDSGPQKGLESGMQGLRFMHGMTPQSPPPGEAIPDDAWVRTVFVADGPDRSVHPRSGVGAVPEQTYVDFYDEHTRTSALTGTEDCVSSDAVATSYRNVALESGGTVGSICLNSTRIVDDIIESTVADASDYYLSRTPISASLTVFIESDEDPTTARFVPRSETDGYQYFAQEDTIAFFGSYRPEIRQGDYSEDFISLRYEYFQDRCFEMGEGANNCELDE
jgi:hypothetical protein